jgi:hypothetical protein
MAFGQKLLTLGLLIMLSACSGLALEDYKTEQPPFVLEEFFKGPIKGWGVVQGMGGKVLTRFDVTMNGVWVGDTGTLTEHFQYYNGDTQERVWTIKKLPDGTYQGKAADIIDQAVGESSGNAMQWQYRMDLKVGDATYRLTFDDWMFQMHDGIVINRSYLKKFGFTVAELTLFMQKQK